MDKLQFLVLIILSASNKIQCLPPLADGYRIKCPVAYDGLFVIAEVMEKGLYRLEKPTGSPVKVLANSRDLKPAPSDGYASPVKNSPGKSPAKSPANKQTQTTRDVVTSDPVWTERQTAHQQRAVAK